MYDLAKFFLEKNYCYIKYHIWTEMEEERKNEKNLLRSGIMNDVPSPLKMSAVVTVLLTQHL